MTDAKPYTFDEVYAAVCMWEYVLERIGECMDDSKKWNRWNAYREKHGMAQTRDTILQFVRELQADYEKAFAEGYEECFDWEYVPEWMEKHAARIVPLF